MARLSRLGLLAVTAERLFPANETARVQQPAVDAAAAGSAPTHHRRKSASIHSLSTGHVLFGLVGTRFLRCVSEVHLTQPATPQPVREGND